jgi:predicted RNA-binding protein with TRAM domain
MHIPDELLAVFNTSITEKDGSYILELPETEVDAGAISSGEVCKVALIDATSEDEHGQHPSRPRQAGVDPEHPPVASESPKEKQPPVSVGERHQVYIAGLGDQGDGFATIDGFNIFVPNSSVGDTLEVEIQNVLDTYGFAEPVSGSE